jgi:hypothetical protein
MFLHPWPSQAKRRVIPLTYFALTIARADSLCKHKIPALRERWEKKGRWEKGKSEAGGVQAILKPYHWMPACAGMTNERRVFRHSREHGNPGF